MATLPPGPSKTIVPITIGAIATVAADAVSSGRVALLSDPKAARLLKKC